MNEYQEAIQHPDIAFPREAKLQACLPQTNKLGIPTAYSGNYAVTFRLENQKAEPQWAIRCFTREVDRVVDRYDKISQFVRGKPDSALSEANLLFDGMLVGGKLFHVIEMEWISGSLLNSYIEESLSAKRLDRLSSLADQFVELGRRLDRLRIAHGDIQHGNVIIDREGQIRLVDYDDMFLENLSPLGYSSGVGHENYQHPKRSNTDYDQTLDRFPLIVTYLSLLALSMAPALWNEHRGGDDCILFRRADFLNPTQSKLFTDLLSIPELHDKIYGFAAVCKSDFRDIPSVRDFASGEFQCRAALIEDVFPEACPPAELENRPASSERHDSTGGASLSLWQRLVRTIGSQNHFMSGASPRMIAWGVVLFGILSLLAIYSMGLLARHATNAEHPAPHLSAPARLARSKVARPERHREPFRRTPMRIAPLPKSPRIGGRSGRKMNQRLSAEKAAAPVASEGRGRPRDQSAVGARSVRLVARRFGVRARNVRKARTVGGSVSRITPGYTTPVPTQSCSQGSVPAHLVSLLAPRFGDPSSGPPTTGDIVVKVRVEADGSVGAAVIEQSSNNVAFDFAALSAARRSTYAPAEEDCTPVAGNVDVSFAY